jgi:hypothetical protein
MQWSIQTECYDYHDERVREIGTICKPAEGEECPKGKKTVDNTCAGKEQAILAQSFHSHCTENVDSTTSSIVILYLLIGKLLLLAQTCKSKA